MALADNKTKIQALIDGINALPDASSLTPELQEKTVTPATASQTVTPDSGYDGLSKVTVNAMPTATQAIPSISVSSSGLITASATQTAGYVTAGTKSMTQQLTTQAAQTITPGTSDKTIASGRYLTGTQTIKGDANLVAENIAEGVSIFGVLGTLASGGGTPEGLTAVEYGEIVPANDLMELTFQHSMGVVPRAGVLWLASNDEVGEASSENVVVTCFANYMDYGYVACKIIGSESGFFYPGGEWTNWFSTTYATFFGPSFAVGRKYNYIICA